MGYPLSVPSIFSARWFTAPTTACAPIPACRRTYLSAPVRSPSASSRSTSWPTSCPLTGQQGHRGIRRRTGSQRPPSRRSNACSTSPVDDSSDDPAPALASTVARNSLPVGPRYLGSSHSRIRMRCWPGDDSVHRRAEGRYATICWRRCCRSRAIRSTVSLADCDPERTWSRTQPRTSVDAGMSSFAA